MRAGATGLAQFDQHTQQSRLFLQQHHGGGRIEGGGVVCIHSQERQMLKQVGFLCAAQRTSELL